MEASCSQSRKEQTLNVDFFFLNAKISVWCLVDNSVEHQRTSTVKSLDVVSGVFGAGVLV